MSLRPVVPDSGPARRLSGIPTSAQRALDGARSLDVGWNAKGIVGKANESVSRVGVAAYG